MKTGRPSYQPALIVVPELNLHTVTLIVTVGLFRNVSCIKYSSMTFSGQQLIRCLKYFGYKVRCEPLELKFSYPNQQGSTIWDQAHGEVWRCSKEIVSLLEGRSLLDVVLPSVSNDLRSAALWKSLNHSLFSPILYALAVKRDSAEGENDQPIIILSEVGDLASLLQEVWSDSYIEFRGITSIKQKSTVVFCWALFLVVRDYLRFGRRSAADHTAVPTVAITYDRGLNGVDYNVDDDWWVRSLPEACARRLILFWHKKPSSPDSLVQNLKRQGYAMRALDKRANNSLSNMPRGFPPVHAWRLIKCLGTASVRAFGRLPAFSWQYSLAIRTLVHVEKWRSLMREENIAALSTSLETIMDPISLAAHQERAIHVGFHWSSLVPGNSAVLPLNQVYFVWGSLYETALRANPASIPGVMLTAGCVYHHPSKNEANRTRQELLQRFNQNSVRKTVCIFDRSLGHSAWYDPDRHSAFVSDILDWADKNPAIGLVFKFKDRGLPRVFAMFPEIRTRIESLERRGQAIVLDGHFPAVVAAMTADATVALGYNSAGVLASINDCKVLFWDPACLAGSRHKEWYRDIGFLEGSQVFSDMATLLSSLDRLLKEEEQINALGENCLDIKGIDPFRDNQAGMRVAGFVAAFIDARIRGVTLDNAVTAASDLYALELAKFCK